MFSDFAPISESGYRAQLNTDPAIMQGVQFLKNERSIVNELIPSLNLISQTNSSGMDSGKIIKGKILEGLTANTPGAPVPALASTISITPTQSSPTTTSSASTSQPPQIKAVSQERIENLKRQFISTREAFYNNIRLLSAKGDGGIADTNDEVIINPEMSLTAGQTRGIIIEGTNYIRNNLDSIYYQITQATNNNIILTNQEYDNIMNELNNINAEIINNYIELNKYEKSVDYISPVAGAEETSTLSTQRYYVYILWFIITIIVLYITISNLINPSSSTWSLAVSLIILLGLFAFLVYNNIGSWYTRVDDDVRSLQLPNFNNLFNFNPLVSIKYTS